MLAQLAWATRRSGWHTLNWQDLAKVVLVIALYGTFDEITQPLVGRSRELLDWLADLTGALTATMLFAGLWWLAGRISERSSERAQAQTVGPLRVFDKSV
jgi:VanZ family protein